MLPRGIVSVLQTPFDERGALDATSLTRLVDSAIAAGVSGFLAPVVASEVEALSFAERERIVRVVSVAARGRVPLIVGASAEEARQCVRHAALAR